MPSRHAPLSRHGLAERGDPVFIQSFEPGNLQWLRDRTPLPLVQLAYAANARVLSVIVDLLKRLLEV